MQLSGKIKNGKIDFSPLYSEIAQNDGKGFTIKLEIGDNVKYWQHQYYRSCLLPAIAKEYGESCEQFFHDYTLKPVYYNQTIGTPYIPCDGYLGVAPKHRAKSRKIEVPTAENKTIIIGYIPSCADMTEKEMRSYILFCENLLTNFMGGNMDEFMDLEMRKNAKL